MKKEVNIKKVDNGYIIKTTVYKPSYRHNMDAMMNLMRVMGVYEGWEEHKEEEIRRYLSQLSPHTIWEKEEKEIVCTSLKDVQRFLETFFNDLNEHSI